jgi:hypothetical protein
MSAVQAERDQLAAVSEEVRAQLVAAQKDNKAMKKRLVRVVAGRQEAKEVSAKPGWCALAVC